MRGIRRNAGKCLSFQRGGLSAAGAEIYFGKPVDQEALKRKQEHGPVRPPLAAKAAPLETACTTFFTDWGHTSRFRTRMEDVQDETPRCVICGETRDKHELPTL